MTEAQSQKLQSMLVDVTTKAFCCAYIQQHIAELYSREFNAIKKFVNGLIKEAKDD